MVRTVWSPCSGCGTTDKPRGKGRHYCDPCVALAGHAANRRKSLWDRARKRAAMDAYGGVCACCGTAELKFLTIDHINGGGNQHRKELVATGMGNNFYPWLKDRGYPPGYRVLCFNCNWAVGHYNRICPHQEEVA